MQSTPAAEARAEAAGLREATSVDSLERSEQAWGTALVHALVEQIPTAQALGTLSANNQPPTAVVAHDTGSAVLANTVEPSGTAGENAEARVFQPGHLHTEVSAGLLGTVRVGVARTPQGLNIVINVADSRVKSLLMTEIAQLHASLKSAGLPVNSLTIDAGQHAGPGLALDRDRPRSGIIQRPATVRLKAYRGQSKEEDQGSDDESLNLKV